MNGFSKLAFVETKLFLRETGAAIGVFGLPVALVIGFGLIPGFSDPQKSLSGQIGTEYIASISVAIVLAVLGLTGVPMGVAIFFAMAQSGGFHRPTVALVTIWVLLACVDVFLIGVFTLLGVKVGEQNEARKHMIAELAEANHRLEEMIAENTGLQAQLLTQAREAGAGDERQRMAREIHDTIAQGLTGIVTQLEAVQQTSNDAERERRIDNAKRLARDSLAEARRSVQALRPQALENSRLPEALADEVARWSVTSGVTGDVETTGEARALHPEVEVTLLRVAQEALANVARHAGASRAGVTLSYMEDLVSVDVRDDGAGFAVTERNGHLAGESPAAGGFGLIAMRQRVSRLAGQLEIESEPGAGTAVSASLPAIPLGPSPQATKAEEST